MKVGWKIRNLASPGKQKRGPRFFLPRIRTHNQITGRSMRAFLWRADACRVRQERKRRRCAGESSLRVTDGGAEASAGENKLLHEFEGFWEFECEPERRSELPCLNVIDTRPGSGLLCQKRSRPTNTL